MRRLLLLVLVLLASIWIGLHLESNPGYAMFTYKHWVMEMPLWAASIGLIILIAVVHYGIELMKYLASMSERYQRWSGRHRRQKARSQTSQGLIDLSEGYWQKAEKSLISGVKGSETPLINYLAAARAAQEQGAYDRRDDYLRSGIQSTSGAEIAVGLTQAQLQLKHKQMEQGLASLRHVHSLVPKHPYVLQQLLKLYVTLEDWEHVQDLLPNLRDILKKEEFLSLEKSCYCELITRASLSSDPEALNVLWDKMPRHLHKEPQILTHYGKQLLQQGNEEQAETIFHQSLKKAYQDDALVLYSNIQGKDAPKQLKFIQSLLKHQHGNPTILRCLGKLCLENELWGQAREYLEQSLDLDANPKTYALLGKLCEGQNDYAGALKAYGQGLNHAV